MNSKCFVLEIFSNFDTTSDKELPETYNVSFFGLENEQKYTDIFSVGVLSGQEWRAGTKNRYKNNVFICIPAICLMQCARIHPHKQTKINSQWTDKYQMNEKIYRKRNDHPWHNTAPVWYRFRIDSVYKTIVNIWLDAGKKRAREKERERHYATAYQLNGERK